ncbi:formin-1-like [Sinocyclocheilus anshuiensis]|uniref:formin-1-like n=1 Tax=Sinocyclocheilus anshuiensis TaxID=1608454 RepID=UPI0007B7C99B|nr:PREDICTED: formin-1-like [Sinocyclocheilus anshuiensis]
MEGTHTVLRLYKPIQELCFISLYFPTRKSRGFLRAGQTPREVQPGDEDTKQRGQYYCEATKGAVAQLHWLAAEHHQLLTDLLSLCSDCADRIKMGNQDGKLLEGHDVSSSNFTISPPAEHKRAASRVRKLKKLGSKKMDSTEEFLQSRIKKKVQSGASEFSPKAPGTPVSIRGRDTPGSGSYVSISSEPLLPMEEHFQITHDGWDFMEEPRSFECEMDLCTELSEFELTLEYEKPLGNQRGCVLRELMAVGNTEGNQQGQSTFGSLEVNQRDVRGDEVATKHNQEPGSHSSLDVDQSHNQQDGQEEIKLFTQVNNEKTLNSRSSKLHPWTRSPTSSSLSGLFNMSYPPANSLQSMSPVLSPLSSQLPSPQMNHRIVLLPEEDDDGNKRSLRDEPKVATEVIDKNGNRRTVTRLDLNLSNHFNVNGASASSDKTSENSLLHPEDIWMLDADESVTQEALRRLSRPDHLDFLRITPPEDDIIGDTPYNPKLGITGT